VHAAAGETPPHPIHLQRQTTDLKISDMKPIDYTYTYMYLHTKSLKFIDRQIRRGTGEGRGVSEGGSE
jgi:hypothetical protein